MKMQEVVASVLGIMLFVVITGPLFVFQVSLWCVLCALFGILGKMWTGNILWKLR